MSNKNLDIETDIPFLKVLVNNQKNINQIMKEGTEHIENYNALLEKFKVLFTDLKNKLVEHLTKIKNIYDKMEISTINFDIKIENKLIEFIEYNNSVNNIDINQYKIILTEKIDSINKISIDVNQNVNTEKNNINEIKKNIKFLDLVKNQKSKLENIIILNENIKKNIISIADTTTKLYDIYEAVVKKLGDEINKNDMYKKINNNYIILKKFSLLIKQ